MRRGGVGTQTRGCSCAHMCVARRQTHPIYDDPIWVAVAVCIDMLVEPHVHLVAGCQQLQTGLRLRTRAQFVVVLWRVQTAGRWLWHR